MKRLALLSLILMVACSGATQPSDPTPSFDQSGGTPPHCNPGYHESQGQGGAAPTCVPNG